MLASSIHSGAFQPGQQDPFDQGVSQKVVVVRPGETQVLRPAARTSCVLHSALNTTHEHSRDKRLNIFQPVLFCFTGIIVPCILPRQMWCISSGTQSSLHLDLFFKKYVFSSQVKTEKDSVN